MFGGDYYWGRVQGEMPNSIDAAGCEEWGVGSGEWDIEPLEVG